MAFAEVRFSTGDLRRFVRSLNLSTKEIKKQVRRIVIDELRDSVGRLRSYADGAKVTGRSHGLRNAAGATSVTDTGAKLEADVGYIKSNDPKVNKQAATLTGTAKESTAAGTIIKPAPGGAKKLAFPVLGKSPSSIISSKGVQRMTAREASGVYHLIYRENAILGRRLGSKVRQLVFLFARKSSVLVAVYIHLDEELELLSTRIAERIRTEVRVLE